MIYTLCMREKEREDNARQLLSSSTTYKFLLLHSEKQALLQITPFFALFSNFSFQSFTNLDFFPPLQQRVQALLTLFLRFSRHNWSRSKV